VQKEWRGSGADQIPAGALEYTVVAALPKGACVLDQIDRLRQDLAILNVSLGDMNGLEVAKRLRDRGCTAKIICLTVHEAIDFVSDAFNVGASGYVLKSRAAEDLTKAIDVVINRRLVHLAHLAIESITQALLRLVCI
jgi:DNA-binding NarL/FixJ family response regulator